MKERIEVIRDGKEALLIMLPLGQVRLSIDDAADLFLKLKMRLISHNEHIQSMTDGTNLDKELLENRHEHQSFHRRLEEVEKWLYGHLRNKNAHRAPSFPPYDMPPEPPLTTKVGDLIRNYRYALERGDDARPIAEQIIEIVRGADGADGET